MSGMRPRAISLSLALAATASVAQGAIRIVTPGDSTTACCADWAPQVREVYSDCLPAALSTYGISAVVVNAGINDSWIDVDLGKTRPRLTRSEYRKILRTIVRRLERDGAASG